MTVNLPGCVKFNVTLDACRGETVSYSIPVADEVHTPDSGHDMQVRKKTLTYQMDDQLGNDYTNFKRLSQDNLDLRLLSDDQSAEFAPLPYDDGYHDLSKTNYGYLPLDFSHPRRSTTPTRFHLKQDNPVIERAPPLANLASVSTNQLLDMADDIMDQVQRRKPTIDLINVSRCCSIDKARYVSILRLEDDSLLRITTNHLPSHQVTFRVRCVYGVQKLVFKSATSCMCSVCRFN